MVITGDSEDFVISLLDSKLDHGSTELSIVMLRVFVLDKTAEYSIVMLIVSATLRLVVSLW